MSLYWAAFWIVCGLAVIVEGLLLRDLVRLLRVRWQRRAITSLQGGSRYADPGRLHRETMLEVDRLARRLPPPQPPRQVAGPAVGAGAGDRSPAAPTRVDHTATQPPRTPWPSNVCGSLSTGDGHSEATSPQLDRKAEYGRGTTLVFPVAVKGRVNGTGRH